MAAQIAEPAMSSPQTIRLQSAQTIIFLFFILIRGTWVRYSTKEKEKVSTAKILLPQTLRFQSAQTIMFFKFYLGVPGYIKEKQEKLSLNK